MNAGGVPNTCKSSGVPFRGDLRGGRVRNTWATCPGVGDSRGKPRVIPRGLAHRWGESGKAFGSPWEGAAADYLVGGVAASQGDDR